MERAIVERRGILTVPGELARESCWGTRIPDVGHKALRRALATVAREFIEVRAKQGEEFVDTDDVHVYGPFPSPAMLMPMIGKEEMLVTQEELRHLTIERVAEPSAFASYLLNAHFLVAHKGAPERGVTKNVNAQLLPAI